MKGAVEGDVEDFAPRGVAHLGEGFFAPQRRIVDEDIDRAELLHGRIRHRLHRYGVGDVADMDQCLAAGSLDLARDRFRLGAVAARVHDDGRTTLRQRQRDCAADVAARAGDDGDLAARVRSVRHDLLSAQRRKIDAAIIQPRHQFQRRIALRRRSSRHARR